MILNSAAFVKIIVMLALLGALISIHYSTSKKMTLVLPIFLIIAAGFLIAFSTQTGAVIKSVNKDSAAFEEGIRAGEIMNSINGQVVKNKQDYARIMGEIFVDNSTKKLEIGTSKNSYILFLNETPQIVVEDIPKTNIKTGLDLAGGARALVQPDIKIDDSGLSDLIQISRNRFNVYGLSDVQIKGVNDLSGNKFMLIEVAGATPSDLKELISKQGKFEARIANTTVFEGGKKDIASVCRNDASCAGITQCSANENGGYFCSFRFTIYLAEEAANKHAKITKNISVDETGRYLSEKLYLYVDDKEVDSLLISIDLKGQVTTQISIQGSGSGITKEDAFNAAKESMNKLQTILITGSLPYRLNIVKLDTISPSLGNDFTYLILLAGGISIFVVGVIIFVKYRRVKASLALLLTSFSELVIILGVASFIRWNLDLPSIAGILATIGTGVDSQIVILDEAEKKSESRSLKDKIKIALFIILTAYATNVVSLIPLYWAGAGLFKGFAITTIIGITAGVFISRPAFADIIKKIEEHE
jgi:preprotein translocase subunit SecD